MWTSIFPFFKFRNTDLWMFEQKGLCNVSVMGFSNDWRLQKIETGSWLWETNMAVMKDFFLIFKQWGEKL